MDVANIVAIAIVVVYLAIKISRYVYFARAIRLKRYLDRLPGPIVYCHTGHLIGYMNAEAEAKYAKQGGAELVGKSIFDCHDESSNEIIRQVFSAFENGADERFLCVSETTGENVYMTAVRDNSGTLVGYYERYAAAV
jgi:hypothetical protein